jgi:HK97 family phage prohead protease
MTMRRDYGESRYTGSGELRGVHGSYDDYDGDPPRATFILSTDEVDRTGDRVDQRGIDLTHFARNPVALLSHDSSSLPIGRWGNIRREGNKTIGVLYFADTETARECFGLVESGMLSGCSIGFNPLETPRQNEHGGYDFGSVELIEASLCSLPMNASALALRSAGGDLSPAFYAELDRRLSRVGQKIDRTNWVLGRLNKALQRRIKSSLDASEAPMASANDGEGRSFWRTLRCPFRDCGDFFQISVNAARKGRTKCPACGRAFPIGDSAGGTQVGQFDLSPETRVH